MEYTVRPTGCRDRGVAFTTPLCAFFCYDAVSTTNFQVQLHVTSELTDFWSCTQASDGQGEAGHGAGSKGQPMHREYKSHLNQKGHEL